ncbi:MAG TPA: S9 family peptidase [Saprospiraceae bacterium]|nr:S9 family peptidase [Saprospiraceae bacterium]
MKIKNSNKAKAPIAKKIPATLEKHEDKREDPYYWLRERENPAVSEYLNAENAYTETILKEAETFQHHLFEEMKGRIKQKDASAPYRDNGYYYQTRFDEGTEYAIYYRKADEAEAEYKELLNINKLAEAHAYYDESSLEVSPNNQLLAFGEDTVSRRIYTLRIKNIETGTFLEDVIPGTTGSYAWSADNQYIFYTLRDPETLRAYQIMRHKIGTSPEADVSVFEETDTTFSTFVYNSKSKKYLVIGSYQTISQEYRVLEADNPTGTFSLIQPRERHLEYSIAHYGEHFYILTNWEARNFRLLKTPETATSKENWEEVVPHREDVLIEDVDVFKDFVVLSERYRGLTRLWIRPHQGEAYYVPFKEDAYLAYTAHHQEFHTPTLRLGYQSMTTPPSVFNFDLKSREFTLLKEQEILGGFDSDHYQTERIMATVRDGVQVPISIVYHKDTPKGPETPLLLYGYGSYGNSMEPYFSSARLSLLNRGFIFAIAHIRGGEEMGRYWYEDGKLLKKKNTFYDFIDCGKYLIEQGYTSSDQLFGMGGSAGGLLVGAVMNMEPSIWRGMVAAVPFVDVVTTMLDDTIPLTTFEYDEWGNPNEPEYYHYMKSYSPYDNVEAKDYPALMVTTGLHDSQVQYWEPAKWVARLRELKTDDNLLLLHTNMDAGHGGASGRFQRLKEVALEYTFLLFLAEKIEN